MARKTTNWNLDRKGPSHVEGQPQGRLPLGLGVRNRCLLKGHTPAGKVLARADAIARERFNKLVWLQDLLTAEGEDAEVVIRDTHRIRGEMARNRYREDREARAAAAAAKTADRAAKAAARKAAKAAAADA